MRCARFTPSLALWLASATAFTPLVRRQDERSWSPAKETGLPNEQRLGWSPKPTDAPIPPRRYGEMDLLKRDFTLGTDTCGFVSGFSSVAVTCVRQSAYCTNDGVGNMDCCTGEYSQCLSTMFSTCLDFTASQQGACQGKGPRTICCWSESPSCYTLMYSTTASPGKVFSILQCQITAGSDTLLATPPNLSTTTSTSSSSSSTSDSSSTTGTTAGAGGGGSGGGNGGGSGDDSGSSTPVGAIVGGVVGGIAAIGLVLFAVFFFIIRKRQQAPAAQGATAVATHPPGMASYPPSGVGVAGQPFSAPAASPAEFKPFPDATAMEQQQHLQSGYAQSTGAYGYPATSPGVPLSGSTSPGFQNQGFSQQYPGAPYPGQAYPAQPYPGQAPPGQLYPGQPHAGQPYPNNELPVHHPLGSPGYRAELT